MKRSDLIAALVKANSDLTTDQARQIVNVFFEQVAEQIASGGRVEFRGFGSFATIGRPERIGRNPKKGEAVVVPAKRVLRFSASKAMKRRLMDVAPAHGSGFSEAAE